jgi:glycosyltransferase involved in cell wall biosynthesis
LRQDYPNIEYIFVDALSTDSTPEVLTRYSNQIDCIIQEKDEGQADAINKGFQHANGELMTYINSDDCYASPTVISEVVDLFAANPSIDLIYGKRYEVDENGFFVFSYPHRKFEKERLYKADYIPQECVFWRKSIYDKSGSFVDKTFNFAMDYELWLRFLAHGAEFLSVDRVFGLFRTYPAQKSIANWSEHGLPEIAKLQKRYLGSSIEYNDMIDCYLEHFSGADRQSHPLQFQSFDWLWKETVFQKKRILGNAPLDLWVYGRESLCHAG